ncbi:MAG TPA: hypothetical protein VHE30_05035 [Polyangiaceae bacterium]|nr:hypothetical protein [Polyangiaceae bacterium]
MESARLGGLAVTIGAIFLAACTGGTETGNPSFTGEVAYTAYSSAPDRIGVRSEGSVANVSSVWLDLGDIGFSADCDADAGAPVKAPALGVGDHAAGRHNVTRFELEPESFCRVTVPFGVAGQDALPEGAPALLRDHSVVVEGTRADGVPFTVLGDAASTFALPAVSGTFAVTASTGKTLLAFDVARWLDLDLASVAPSAGAVTVSADEHADLHAVFLGNLGPGIVLLRDEDGDGHVDPAPETLARGR